MAIKVKVASMPLPYSLGKVFPGAAFATLSVPLTQNIIPVEQDNITLVRMVNGIFIVAFQGTGAVAGNTFPIYICNTADPPDLVAFTNVVAILPPGYTFPRSKDWSQNRDLSTLYIGAENATDFALVSIDSF